MADQTCRSRVKNRAARRAVVWMTALVLSASVLASPLTASAIMVPVIDTTSISIQTGIAASSALIAQAVVSQEIKESILDGIAFMVLNAFISMLTDSIVQWINSGFEGSPGFVEDPAAFFADFGNEVAGQFINSADLNFLCDPLQLPFIRGALEFNYRQLFRQRARCTPLEIAHNLQTFTNGKFNDGGGWGAWFQTFTSTGNRYGAYLTASIEMDSRLTRAIGLKQDEVSWGRGFLPQRDQQSKKIKTPGSVVEQQLNNALDSGKRRIEVADEINEIVGALINALFKTVNGGLSGASSATSYNYNQTDRNSVINSVAKPTEPHAGQNIFPVDQFLLQSCSQPPCRQSDPRTLLETPVLPPTISKATAAERRRVSLINAVATQGCTVTDQYNINGPPGLAIDGSQSTMALSRKLRLQSDTTGLCYNAAWWKITLPEPEDLDGITIYTESVDYPLKDARLVVEHLDGNKTFLQLGEGQVKDNFTQIFDQTLRNVTSLTIENHYTANETINQNYTQYINYINNNYFYLRLREVELYRHLRPTIDTGSAPKRITADEPFNPLSGVTGQFYDRYGNVKGTIPTNAYQITVKDYYNPAVVVNPIQSGSDAGKKYQLPAGNYLVEYQATVEDFQSDKVQIIVSAVAR